MKKRIITTIFLTVISLSFFYTGAGAAEISAGATTWYSWWDFEQTDSDSSTEFDPTFLYGPAISIKFSENYNLTFVFLYGKFDMNEKNTGGTDELSRYDSDLALNYRLNSYFKIFAGAKYMAYEMTDFKHRAIGPGAGISAVLPLGNDFYILGNISGLYLWGEHQQEDQTYGTQKDKYNEYGINSSISLAYYIVPASVTLSLGGRYQFIKSDFDSSTESQSDLTHHFYGITASAIYSFNI